MKSILDQLHDDDAIVAMYLADELPAGDRQKVDARLAGDAEFRAKLHAMSQLRDFCQNSIRALDERDSAEHLESAALRRAARMLQQWASRRRRPQEAAQRFARPIPWLRYGLSAAALMGLVYLVWWSNRPVTLSTDRVTEVTPDVNPSSGDTLSPQVKLSMLLNTMDAAAADDAPDRQVVALGVKTDELNFSVDAQQQDDSQ